MQSLKRMLNFFLNKILPSSILFKGSVDLGLFCLRIFPSFFLFYYHGLGKLNKGVESWIWLGEAAMPIIGINFGFAIFGFLAALSESIFALFVIVGFCTRIVSSFIFFTMFMAGSYHLVSAESGEEAYIYAVIYFVIFLLGPGKYSLDSFFFNKNEI